MANIRFAVAPGEKRLAAGTRARAKAAESRAGYHHGDLRAALLAAAEAELAEHGVEGFTLRGCARRAGVSHAAPAHHFRDVRGVLTAMATIGFERLAASMQAFVGDEAPGSRDYLVAIARGYVAFAAAHPGLFRLVFRHMLLDMDDPAYKAAGAAAFAYPVRSVAAESGVDDPMADPALAAEVLARWSLVHGFSELMLAGQFDASVCGDRGMLVEDLVPAMMANFRPLPRRKPLSRASAKRPRATAR